MPRLARSVLPIVGFIGLAACASSGPAPDPNPAPRTSVGLDGGLQGAPGGIGATGNAAGSFGTITRDNSAAVTTIPMPTDVVFPAVLRAYEALGITPNTVVSANGTVAMRTTRVRRRLGKTNLSEFITCGRDAVGNPTADSYDITLSVESRIAPKGGDESTVATTVFADARNPAVSGAVVPCGSTGRLELRVGFEAKKQLGTPSTATQSAPNPG